MPHEMPHEMPVADQQTCPVTLVLLRSRPPHKTFALRRGELIVGRQETTGLRVPLGDVSRRHCRLTVTDTGATVEDLDSSNGTFVNGERVGRAELGPGDVLRVGSVKFFLRVNGLPEEPPQKPAADAEADAEPKLDADDQPPADPMHDTDLASAEDLMSDL